MKDKLKSIFGKINGNKEEDVITNKKKIENLAVFLVILIITLVVINVIWSDQDEDEANETDTSDKVLAETGESETDDEDYSYYIKSELEEILSNIEGVGSVKVMITYSSSSTIVPVYNEESSEESTEETDSEGGTRTVTQTEVKKEVVYDESDGDKTIITQSTTSPEIEGAIITAEGAGNSEVKANIIQAVEAATGLPTHKIQVFKMTN